MGVSAGAFEITKAGLGVLAEPFPLERVQAILAATGREGKRKRLLPASMMVYYVIALGLFVGCRDVLRPLLGGAAWIWPNKVRVATESASRKRPKLDRILAAKRRASADSGVLSSTPVSDQIKGLIELRLAGLAERVHRAVSCVEFPGCNQRLQRCDVANGCHSHVVVDQRHFRNRVTSVIAVVIPSYVPITAGSWDVFHILDPRDSLAGTSKSVVRTLLWHRATADRYVVAFPSDEDSLHFIRTHIEYR
jgi:hypothetical protein